MFVVTGLQRSNTRQSTHWQLQIYSSQISDSPLIGSYMYIVAKDQIVNSLVVTGIQWSNTRQLLRILSYLNISLLILSYFILSYIILSYLILSYLIFSYIILSYLIFSFLIFSYLFLTYICYKPHLDLDFCVPNISENSNLIKLNFSLISENLNFKINFKNAKNLYSKFICNC